MTSEENPTSSNILELDKIKIDETINKDGQYEDEGVLIKKSEKPELEEEDQNEDDQENKDDYYLASIERGPARYIGTLNGKFQRDGLGLQNLENGDQYFGQFAQDQRNGEGYYFWTPKTNENRVQTEFYDGKWKDNKKDEKGAYIWMDEPTDDQSYENAIFDAYIGELKDEKYTRGTYLSKTETDFYLYHGNFDDECKKSDESAFFYTSQLNRIFHGAINKDLLVNGYIAYFEPDSDEIKELVHCTFNEDGSIDEIKRQKDINEDEAEDEIRNIKNFKSVIFDGNYFPKIYTRYRKAKTFIEDNANSIELLEDKENIPKIQKLLKKYNSKSIYNSIEENFFGREL